jgi:hypothetical protein
MSTSDLGVSGIEVTRRDRPRQALAIAAGSTVSSRSDS